jgi:hypothetical protein
MHDNVNAISVEAFKLDVSGFPLQNSVCIAFSSRYNNEGYKRLYSVLLPADDNDYWLGLLQRQKGT